MKACCLFCGRTDPAVLDENTLINLDIVISIKQKTDRHPADECCCICYANRYSTYPSKQPAMYALEMSQGWFKKNKFEEGTI